MAWIQIGLLMLLVLGKAVAAPPQTLILDQHLSNKLAIAPSSWLLEDVEKSVNLLDLQKSAVQFDWQSIDQAAPNFSFSKSAYWMWFRIHNPKDELVKRVLQIEMPLQDYIDLYQVNAENGHVIKSFKTGDRRPYDTRPVRAKDFVFPLDFQPGQTYDFFIRFDSHDGLYDALPMTLWGQKLFHEANSELDLVHGAYYGALLAILLFNLFLYLSTRERVFLLYSLYLGAFFVWNFTFRGWSYLYWWPDWPHFNSQMVFIAGSFIFIFMVWFSTEYLQTKTSMPKTHKALWGLAWLVVASLSLGIMNFYALPYQLMTPVYVLTILLMMFAGIRLLIKGQRAAKFFVLAWAVLLIGGIIYFLRVAGLMPSSALTEYALQVGSVLEFMLLAFGLADRINVLKSEKVALQQAALENERTASARLEDLVKRRTEQLEVLNRRLALQAITDGLTHLYNRRHFNECLDNAVANRPFALLLIDIDHFKAYNDYYGHQAGDKALIQVARTLHRLCAKQEGEVFRIGGEEFACLVAAKDFEPTVSLAQTICNEITAQRIEHIHNVVPYITVSIGLVWVDVSDDMSADQVFAKVDDALYQAKEQGRNQVVSDV